MGFDIYGMKATSETGKYFRNNVWWWRELANYVTNVCDIDDTGWHTNDGYKISKKTATKIADTLFKRIENGDVATYEREYTKELESLPLETCIYCKGTGKRDDEYVKGECNVCSGKGKVKNWRTDYPFSVDNVKEFAEFCKDSGGFEIC